MVCQQCDNQSEIFCMNCQEELCSECDKVIHGLKKKKDHIKMKLDDYLKKISKEKGYCLTHPKEKCIAYCITCDDPICLECIISLHDQHERRNLVEPRDDQLNRFSKNLKDLNESHENYHIWNEKLKKNKDSCQNEIEKYFQDLRNLLNEKEKETLKKLEEMYLDNERKCKEDLYSMKYLIDKMDNEVDFIEQIKLNKISQNHLLSLLDPNQLKSKPPVCDGFIFKGKELKDQIQNSIELNQKETELTIQQRIKVSLNSKVEFLNELFYQFKKISIKIHVIDHDQNTLLCPSSLFKIQIQNELNPISYQLERNDKGFFILSFIPNSGVHSIDILLDGKSFYSNQINVKECQDEKNGIISFLSKQGNDFYHLDKKENELILNLKKYQVMPYSYSLNHGSSNGESFIRSWNLEGSNDGKEWTILKEHKHDFSLNSNQLSFTWNVPMNGLFFTKFRIFQNGKNSSGNHQILLNQFELHGKICPEN